MLIHGPYAASGGECDPERFNQAEHGGGLGGFRHLTQPGQPALAGFLLALRQCIEALPLFGGQPLG
jgi:hypothetical protein